MQEEIFHDFVQINEDENLRRFDGIGPGLTISEKIVGIFGGKLNVESELGKVLFFILQLFLSLPPTYKNQKKKL